MTQTIWTSAERRKLRILKSISPAITPCPHTWMTADIELNVVSVMLETEIHVAARDRSRKGTELAMVIALGLS